MSDRLILAIDTSFGPVSAALISATGDLVGHVEADNPPGVQAETLPPLVAELFAKEGALFAGLSRVAVTVGPGAFTGVRVGLAFAKGLRLATGAAVLGFTTLECLAAQVVQGAGPSCVAVAIDAKRGEVYLQVFDTSLAAATAAQVLPIAAANELARRHLRGPSLLTGSGAALLDPALGKTIGVSRIDAVLLARRALAADPARYPAKPAYLRAPDARLPI